MLILDSSKRCPKQSTARKKLKAGCRWNWWMPILDFPEMSETKYWKKRQKDARDGMGSRDALPTQPSKVLPPALMAKTCWVTKETEAEITYHRGEEDGTTCWLCQQHSTTPRRLRVHLPQHFITTFCPCGELSYHMDYILCHQRTMNCYQGHSMMWTRPPTTSS